MFVPDSVVLITFFVLDSGGPSVKVRSDVLLFMARAWGGLRLF